TRRSNARMQQVIIPLVLRLQAERGAPHPGHHRSFKMFLVKAFVGEAAGGLLAALDAGYPAAAAASDLSYAYHTGYYGGHYGAPSPYAAGDYGHYAVPDNAGGQGAGGGGGTADDLQAHFSTNTATVQQAPSAARNATKMVARTD
ncbi:Protein of unknown function, partial [Gryllus bimaculatus]